MGSTSAAFARASSTTAGRAANAMVDEYIDEMPAGYETVIGENGVRLFAGKITERGTHDGLQDRSETYNALFQQ